MIFLDHDLGGEVYVDSDIENCGMEVVRWFEEVRPDFKGMIIIHSWNAPAAYDMEARLSRAGYTVRRTPFGRFWLS